MTGERPDTHDFLLQNPGAKHDPFKVALKLARGITDLPETAATFRPSDFVDRGAKRSRKGMLLLQGSWRVPDGYTSGGKGERWVNPNYPNTEVYSDVYVRCACGALMVREEKIHGETVAHDEHEHTDDCYKQDRLRARARLCERRREVMLEGYHHGQSGRKMGARLGLKGQDSVGPVAKDIGVSAEQRRREGKRVAARTMAILLEQYSPRLISEVYSVSGETVRANVRRLTDADPGELYERRRQS